VDRVPAEDFSHYIEGATVLIAGAAGFLGSSVAVQAKAFGAAMLVLVDSAEATLVELATTLRAERGPTSTAPVLADIRSAARMAEVLARHRPDVVFHTAAYKHVPLLEAHPSEAAATNVLGTKNLVEAARAVGVERFVSFSTDKAVRPANVLGRTKAAAEWIVAAAADDVPGSRYSSVRLANVADAPAGILECFRRQANLGGPLTVTDPRATRLLMTSSEAVALAFVAGGLGGSGDVLWLDVGPPVRILDLARRVAAGRKIEIELVGLRPGENLREASFSDGDQSATPCDRVFAAALPRVDPIWLDAWTSELAELVDRASDEGVRRALATLFELPSELAASGVA
jgi:dTDP-glucose 4,6-dehydratase